MAARARRPRKTDCDPSTDFNRCAREREYSIETARRSASVDSTLCPRLRAASSSPGVWQLMRYRVSTPWQFTLGMPHGDHDVSLLVPLLNILECFRDPFQRIASVDDRPERPSLGKRGDETSAR